MHKHHGAGNTERAKDFKGTFKKLIRYMGKYKIQMLFVAIFAIGGTVFNIVGPKILGKATTEISSLRFSISYQQAVIACPSGEGTVLGTSSLPKGWRGSPTTVPRRGWRPSVVIVIMYIRRDW